METITFYKYQGAGNDFIIVDPTANASVKGETELIRLLCDRRFGIGADGFILWEPRVGEPEDFYMTYYNADGRESTLCGNGGRCIAAFAHQFQGQARQMNFLAIDGPHQAEAERLGGRPPGGPRRPGRRHPLQAPQARAGRLRAAGLPLGQAPQDGPAPAGRPHQNTASFTAARHTLGNRLG